MFTSTKVMFEFRERGTRQF